MMILRAAGVVLASAAAYAALLAPARYYGGAIPIPLGGLVVTVLAVALPGAGTALLARRWRLSRPSLLALAGYCLGSGAVTSVLMGGGEPAARYVLAGLAHAATATVLMPAEGGGFIPFWGNLLWVAIAFLFAQEGVSAARKNPSANGM